MMDYTSEQARRELERLKSLETDIANQEEPDYDALNRIAEKIEKLSEIANQQ